ncbi:MAG: MFS transporter [Alphaproteobacteria bacterium]|nr:MFS transporter [Alphaproteobacteria bacterium]
MVVAPWFGPLAVTLLMQLSCAFLVRVIPVIGPVVTESAGVPAERIGHLAALHTAGTMWFLVCGAPLLHRYGPVRSLQLGGLVGALGLLLTLTDAWPLIMLSALLVGLGYGPAPPAGSDVLARHTPKQHRGVIFSIKQAGVPLGGALAGLLVPPLVAAFGWRTALAVAALFALLPVLAVQHWRASLDADRAKGQRLSVATLLSLDNLRQPFRAVTASPRLTRLSAVGFAFAVAQGCLFSFQATFLNVEIGLSLAAAGSLFALGQGVGVPGRVFVGWVADRLGSGVRMLLLLALGSGTMMIVTALITPAWPPAAIAAASALAGLTVGTWNGVYLAEVASAAKPEAVGEATSGSTFLTFIGYVVGPFVFALIVGWTGSYAPAFIAAGALPLLGALVLMRLR